MTEEIEISQGKSITELWQEAAWFLAHTLLAILSMLIANVVIMPLTHPSADDPMPKYIGTALAFFVPMIAGYLIARVQQNDVARFVWISGLLIFVIVCVWVIDLPTGPGLCEHCLLTERLIRTFFDVNHGSGLIAGQGLMVGTWVPLSTFGYAIGARFALFY